jgi:isoquinoline 1-oxidoreductase
MSAGSPWELVQETGPEFAIEPERYELLEAAGGGFEATRREFLRLVGGGLVVLCLLSEGEDEAEAQQPGRGRRRGGGAQPREISAWLHIAEDGTVTAHTGKAEVGQDIRTSLSQAVADELRIPLESVRLVMADTAVVPFDMGTFGSRTTPTMSVQLRRAAAAARERLVALAAEEWKADRSKLEAAGGKVADPSSGKSAAYGALTHGRKLVEAIAADVPLTPAEKWTVAGRPAAKVNGRDFVTGRHKYASDVNRPGMLHGKVLRPPAYNARLKSVNLARAKAMPGVVVVRDGDFIGVAAPDEPTAARALAAIEAEWTQPEHPVSDSNLYEALRQHARGGPARATSVAEAAGSASGDERTREATYTIAYIAHAPLEPRTAVAEWEGEKLTVWTGSQRPFGVRTELVQALGIPEDRVRVIVPDTGAGYGGKHTGEAAVEAARLARGVGKPVKRLWTREEEFTWAYFRPAGVIDARGSVGKDGKLASWDFHNYNSGGSGVETPYDVPRPRRQSAFHASESPLRQGSYRALASTANHFARESLMDELAADLGIDPLEFRLRNLKNDRLRAVFQAAAERFGWGKNNKSAGRGCGIAGGTEKGGYIATCAEVEVDRARGQVKVVRLVSAFECGAVVSPDFLANQVEGALIMGLGGALFEAIRFEGGRIKNPRFSRYRVPRFSDTPEIDVVLLDRKDLPSAGAGETPIVAVAPAIANAIHAACGVRLRSLPLVPDGLKV